MSSNVDSGPVVALREGEREREREREREKGVSWPEEERELETHVHPTGIDVVRAFLSRNLSQLDTRLII